MGSIKATIAAGAESDHYTYKPMGMGAAKLSFVKGGGRAILLLSCHIEGEPTAQTSFSIESATPDWLEGTSALSDTHSKKLTIVVPRNDSGKERTGVFVISNGQNEKLHISVTQSA